MIKVKKNYLFICFSAVAVVMAMGFSSFVHAGSVSGVLGGGVWTGWTQFQDNPDRPDGTVSEDWREDGFVNPGNGGQAFDAEYLFYKYDKATKAFSFGMQAGFDIKDGKQGSYYSGDVEFRFNGVVYGLDYGFTNTLDYVNTDVGSGDTAGIYENTTWGGSLPFGQSAPFAMTDGTLMSNVNFTQIDSGSYAHPNGDTSFYNQVSFDLTNILGGNSLQSINAHWTMSCGNDEIHGTHAPVPEPGTIALLGIGLAGLAGVGARRRLKKNAVDKS